MFLATSLQVGGEYMLTLQHEGKSEAQLMLGEPRDPESSAQVRNVGREPSRCEASNMAPFLVLVNLVMKNQYMSIHCYPRIQDYFLLFSTASGNRNGLPAAIADGKDVAVQRNPVGGQTVRPPDGQPPDFLWLSRFI